MSSESTCFQLQCNPSINFVACSKTELFISEKLWVDQVKGRSPKKLKKLIEVPNVVHRKVHVLSFNMILIASPQRFLTPSYPIREDLGDNVKGSSPKKLNLLIEVP